MKRIDLALRIAFGLALASLPFLHYRCAEQHHRAHQHVHQAKLAKLAKLAKPDREGGSHAHSAD